NNSLGRISKRFIGKVMTSCNVFVYNRWKLITTSLAIAILEAVLRDTFLAKIRNSKKATSGHSGV
ncbi:MAG: hypothetical protein ACKPKO_46950, partial [Candidatus Fonsibacter sp.]